MINVEDMTNEQLQNRLTQLQEEKGTATRIEDITDFRTQIEEVEDELSYRSRFQKNHGYEFTPASLEEE